jgi:4-hydroxybenzoate polyprenyltransferase
MNTARAVFRAARPRQWVKNLFVFMPVLFGGKLFSAESLLNSATAFLAFCLAAGSVYLLNDVRDRKTDIFHPLKKKRPVASGNLDHKTALTASALFLAASLSLGATVSLHLALTVLAYTGLNTLYSFRIKHVILLDVIAIATGFELRVWAGGLASGIIPSVWLQLCVFLLALFLGLLKRRYEIISLEKDAHKHRKVLSLYSIDLLDQMVTISAALCIIFYCVYSVLRDLSSGATAGRMIYTIPLVIFGVFRYFYIAHSKEARGDPGEILFSDLPLILALLLWAALSVLLIYYP